MGQRPEATRSSSGLERENHEKNGMVHLFLVDIENRRRKPTEIRSRYGIIAWCRQVVAPFNIITMYLLSLGKNGQNRNEKKKASRQKARRMWKKKEEIRRSRKISQAKFFDYSFADCIILLLREITRLSVANRFDVKSLLSKAESENGQGDQENLKESTPMGYLPLLPEGSLRLSLAFFHLRLIKLPTYSFFF